MFSSQGPGYETLPGPRDPRRVDQRPALRLVEVRWCLQVRMESWTSFLFNFWWVNFGMSQSGFPNSKYHLNKLWIDRYVVLPCSLGLVFWELARRTKSLEGCVEDYAQPYFEVVDADPGLDDMRRAVCDKGFRPTVPDRWQETEVKIIYPINTDYLTFSSTQRNIDRPLRSIWFLMVDACCSICAPWPGWWRSAGTPTRPPGSRRSGSRRPSQTSSLPPGQKSRIIVEFQWDLMKRLVTQRRNKHV